MKRFNVTKMIGVMLLVGASLAPLQTYADAEDVAAIQALQKSNEANLGPINANTQTSLSDLDMIKQYTGSLPVQLDMKNSEMVQALLNYMAAASVNQTLYNQELLFMAAPGSVWAVTAGSIVGKTKVGQAALALSNQNFLASVTPYSYSTNITGPLAAPPPPPGSTPSPGLLLTKSAVYDTYFAPFVTQGDSNGLTVVNLAQFMQSDNLNTMKITPDQSKQMINLVVNPFPVISQDLTGKITAAKADPSVIDLGAKESIVDGIVENAIVSVSMSALSDIVARRTPGSDPSGGQATVSVMESMDQYSAQRFTNPSWYTQISTASDTALLRELAHMQAYNSWMQFQQFRVQEQQMALLATMNAVLAKMNAGLDRLNVQMAAAEATAQKTQSDFNAANSVKCPSGQMNNGTGSCVCASGKNAGAAPDSGGNCPS